ncbi:MAG TPA: TonB-dependent receptor [Terriglobales bacterium]|nr:TonB-dependent receptor [Terriglobales bacterium]
MIKLFPVFVLAACSLCAQAEGLRGTVRDASGAVIPGARIVVDDAGQRTERVSDGGGRFSFPDVAPGAELLVQAAGFSPVRQRVIDRSARIDVVLPVLPLTQEIVVTPQRSATPVAQTDAAVVRFSGKAIADSGGATLDEKLRQAPGFSLLRRTGSRAANPTTQGASLRGLAASGASRLLVIDDDVPLNDPFGGWVYWDRVPAETIDAVELMAGGASHLYGSSALAGVVNIFQQHPPEQLAADINFGNQNTPEGSVVASHPFGPWTLNASAEGFRTDGYVAVLRPDRGSVDTPLTLHYASVATRLQRRLAGDGNAFASVSLFNEGRGNGTPLQVNSTRLAEVRAGLDLRAGPGLLALRAYGDAQRYSQTFSAIAVDRSRETLTSWQLVPAQQAGGGAQWTGLLANRHSIFAGSELRVVRGVSNEISFNGGKATPSSAGGGQTLFGNYVGDSIRFRRLTLTLGARLDRWSNEPLLVQGSRDGLAASPHAGAVVSLGRGFSWTSSAYRSFRVPTLNELYRNFRVGNILTLANPALNPEHLDGAETGIGFSTATIRARANFFWNQVTDPVANSTLRVTPQLITRQRQNLGSLRSRGLELSLESRLAHRFTIRTAYQFLDATVLTSPANLALVGLVIPQVPRHAMSAAIAYSGHKWTFSAQARASSRQFDDDQNLLPLDSMFNLDVFASRRLARGVSLYCAAENALDQRYIVGRTPTPSWGPPVLVKVGARLELPHR